MLSVRAQFRLAGVLALAQSLHSLGRPATVLRSCRRYLHALPLHASACAVYVRMIPTQSLPLPQNHMEQMRRSGLNIEQRTLKIGDAVWVARSR